MVRETHGLSGERINIIVEPWLKQRVREKCCATNKTITQAITLLIEKWLKEK